MYFKYLPDLEYLKYDKNPYQGDLVLVKNLFVRTVFSKFAEKYVTIFDPYIIKEGDRLDILAYNLYGDSYYDWIIVLVNDYTNIYEQWPKDPTTLEDYVYYKYGLGAYDVHHYETYEVKNSLGQVVLPSGLEVNSDFSITVEGTTFSGSQLVYEVTNYQYEENLNEEKRNIQLLKPRYLDLFVREVESILKYDPKGTDVINPKLKTTKKSALPTI